MSSPARDLAIIALGANLGEPLQTLGLAIEQLQSLSKASVAHSSFWRSRPVDCPPGSPDFVNAVAVIEPQDEETAESLLDKLQEMERQFGRQPKLILNEARPLDLDLISFRSEILNSSRLVLPHPRAHLRRFVLQPLAELMPAYVLPGQKLSVSELLARLKHPEDLTRIT